MEEVTGRAILYYERKKRILLLVRVARRGLSTVELDGVLEFNEARRETNEFVDAVKEALDSFRTNVDIRTRSMSADDGRVFVKNHLKIEIEQFSDGCISFLPMHHERGGYTASFAERVRIEPQEIHARFNEGLHRALEIAT